MNRLHDIQVNGWILVRITVGNEFHIVMLQMYWLVSAVMSVYMGARTVVRTVHDNSHNFEIKVACIKA